MNWKDNINTIREIFPGHYRIILNFATKDIVRFLLSDKYKYVWVYHHDVAQSDEWQNYQLPLIDRHSSFNVLSRKINFDFALPTIEFREVLPKLSSGITLSQLNELPKYYLDPGHIKGKSRYELLKKECDYLFEIDIPSATDYGTLISPDKEWLQALLDNKAIDWNNLP